MRLVAVAALVLAAGACRPEPPVAAEPSAAPAPRATLVLEPPRLRIGDVATLEIAVVTPPDLRVLPYAPPEVPGLWLLDAEALPPEASGERRVQRTRVRVRPRELGSFEWPESEVVLESAAGERTRLSLPGRRIEVVSVIPQMRDRTTPFGLRAAEPAAPPGAPSPWLALLGGAGIALAAAALWHWRAGRRAAASSPPRRRPPRRDLWDWAEEELSGARAALAADPRRASNAGARVLRLYVERRFGTPVRADTTPELELRPPPLAMRSRWPTFVGLLRRYDELRFRPGEEAGERVARVLDETLHFVEDSAQGRRPS